jgi:multiple sugar transport system permease protein
MLAPAIVILILLAIAPLVYLFYYAFHRQSVFQHEPAVWVGTENFEYLFNQSFFIDAIKRTFMLAGVAIVLEMTLGFLLAALVFRGRHLPGMGFVRTLLTTPILLAPIVTALMWRFMYEPNFGVINYLFAKIGLPTEAWLADPDYALWSVAVVDVWQWTPFVFLVVLAGMYGLPRNVYEAAELDGTPLVRQALFITIPLLKRVLLIVLLLRLIDLMRLFDIIVGTTQGGPGVATQTLPVYIWVTAFQQFSAGDAAAASLVLLAIVAVLITILLRLTARQGLVGRRG